MSSHFLAFSRPKIGKLAFFLCSPGAPKSQMKLLLLSIQPKMMMTIWAP